MPEQMPEMQRSTSSMSSPLTLAVAALATSSRSAVLRAMVRGPRKRSMGTYSSVPTMEPHISADMVQLCWVRVRVRARRSVSRPMKIGCTPMTRIEAAAMKMHAARTTVWLAMFMVVTRRLGHEVACRFSEIHRCR